MKITLLFLLTIVLNFYCFAQPAKLGSMVLIHSKGQNITIGLNSNELLSYEPAQGYANYVGKHKVSFTYDFYMDTTLVTQRSYNKIMGNNPSNFKTGNLELPVEQVNWYDAVMYCIEKSKLENLDPVYTYTSVKRNGNHIVGIDGLKFDIKKNGYRLATNAEYEFATRAKTSGNYFFSPSRQNLTALANPYAWSMFNANKTTHPVATKKPNPFGLYDMVGNLFAWCNDWDNPYTSSDEVDPIGKSTGTNRIAKGGHWDNDIELHMRTEYHTKLIPTFNDSKVGLRTVRTLVACTETPITPKYKINGGSFVPGAEIKAQIGDTVTLRPEIGISGTWQWQGPSAFNSQKQEVSLILADKNQEGNYQVQFKSSNACISSSTYTIKLNNVVAGLWDNSTLNGSSIIYPNPFVNNCQINLDKKFDYVIYSMDGHVSEQGNETRKEGIGSNLMTGNYILKIKSEGKSYHIKISKE